MFHFKKDLDELAQFKNNNKMTRSVEKTYLEKCRDFVEMMIASESLASMTEMYNDDNVNELSNEDHSNVNELSNEDHSNVNELSNEDHSNVNELSNDMINICNEYQQYCQQQCRQILDKYKLDMEEYSKCYEKQLNEYYTDYTRTILWDYYENTTKKLEKINQALMADNQDLSECVKSIVKVETNYNNMKKDYKHLSLEYTEIYRRLLIMISEYNKLYNQYQKSKKVVKKMSLEDTDDFIYIGDDYNYKI
jgi:hypothetical protein